MEIYSGMGERETGQLIIFACSASLQLVSNICTSLPYTDQTTKKTGVGTCRKPLGIVNIEMISTTCPGN